MHISKIDRLSIVYRIIANEKTGVEVMYCIPHLIDWHSLSDSKKPNGVAILEQVKRPKAPRKSPQGKTRGMKPFYRDE